MADFEVLSHPGNAITEAFISTLPEQSKLWVKAILGDIADVAHHSMLLYVPKDTWGTYRRINESEMRWVPGGSHGGGSWEKSVGVRGNEPGYPWYVHTGTGLYGPHRSMITPTHAASMKFHWKGRYWDLERTRGQKPQPFVRDAYEDAKLYAQGSIHRFGKY